MKPVIAYLGLGAMGSPMAARLLEAGYPLAIWNRNPVKAAALAERGARLAADPTKAVADADFVFSMVADDAALEEICLGSGRMVAAMKPGALHASMSTILPATARRLALCHRRQGTAYVAAPVFGRPEAAAAGRLWICLSGAADDRQRLLPILTPLCLRHYGFGDDVGAANVVKLAGNFMIAAAIEAMAEAFVFGEKNGLKQEGLADFFASTLFSCPIYQNYGRIIAARQFEPAGFRLALGRKDVHLVAETARISDVPMPILGTLLNRFAARVAKGGSELDWTSIAIDVAVDAGLDREPTNGVLQSSA